MYLSNWLRFNLVPLDKWKAGTNFLLIITVLLPEEIQQSNFFDCYAFPEEEPAGQRVGQCA